MTIPSQNEPTKQPETPSDVSEVPRHDSTRLFRQYRCMWVGRVAIKRHQAAVHMHFVSGNPHIVGASLPRITDEDIAPVRVSHRMRLAQTELEIVSRKMQLEEEHCILVALPYGNDHNEVTQESVNLGIGLLSYLIYRNSAGVVNVFAAGSQQPAFIIYLFPPCDFQRGTLSRIAPSLLHLVADVSHMMTVIIKT